MTGSPPSLQPARSYSWSDAWTAALTRPSLETFQSLLGDPAVSISRALRWLFVSALVADAIALLLIAVLGYPLDLFRNFDLNIPLGQLLIGLLCGTPLLAALGLIGFLVNTGIIHLVARLLGGKGSFERLAYAIAAYGAPLAIVTSVLYPIPYLRCIASLLGLYALVLMVIAVNAAHDLGWGKAILASFAIMIAVILITICIVVLIVLLVALGPDVGGVFSNILESIVTPVP